MRDSHRRGHLVRGGVDRVQMLPDILKSGLEVVFCGINPGESSAEAGHHFVRRSNRFWRAIYLAGFTPHQISPEDDRTLLDYDCGLTTAVSRSSRRASDVSFEELMHGAGALELKIAQYAPRSIAFLGKPVYQAIQPHTPVEWGRQDASFGGAEAWVLPNPSGLNRGFALDDLVRSYAQLREWLETGA